VKWFLRLDDIKLKPEASGPGFAATFPGKGVGLVLEKTPPKMNRRSGPPKIRGFPCQKGKTQILPVEHLLSG